MKADIAVSDSDSVEIIICEEHAVRRARTIIVGNLERAGAEYRHTSRGSRGNGYRRFDYLRRNGRRAGGIARNDRGDNNRAKLPHGDLAAGGGAKIAEHGWVEGHAAFTARRGGLGEWRGD